MDDDRSSSFSANANREHRRLAAASRRAARDGDDGGGDSLLMPTAPPKRRRKQHHHEHYFQFNFLSSLSQALSNIDRHNRDYFSKRNESGGDDDDDDDNVIMVEGGSMTRNYVNHQNAQRMTKMNKKKKSASPASPPHNFSSYLKFNRLSLASLLTFTICYLLVLICCLPMITHSNDVDPLPTENENHDIQRGASFQYIRGRKTFLKAKHVLAKKMDAWRERSAMSVEQAGGGDKNSTANQDVKLEREELKLVESIVRNDYFARRDGILLEQAIHDFEGETSDFEIKKATTTDAKSVESVHNHWKDAVNAWDKEFVQDTNNVATNIIATDMGQTQNIKTPGFVVLGMHRSGTSMLSGLLVKGFGYETGGPLIGASVSVLFLLP